MPRVQPSRLLRLHLLTLILFVFMSFEPAGAAAQTADEADIEFQLGADRYDAGDFKSALQHFLASNRLAPNKNVLFNIARCYEELKLLPDAYRYLMQSLEQEQSESGKQRIQESLARLKPKVALLTVETDPPGATIYLDREDLGSRGSTPRTLALPEGEHTVLVKLSDYEPAWSGKVSLQLGQETQAKLKLKPILGTIQVTGTPSATAHFDSQTGPSCRIPCSRQIRPGKHLVLISREGFRGQELPVEIVANGSVQVRATLEPLSGSVVVNADVRDALISIDGQPRAFTPSVVTLPVGKHEVLVSQSGFRPVRREVLVEAEKSVKLDFELSGQEEVVGASRAAEAVEDAPASVTIISRQELRAMGYPTIAEAIRGVRGLYLSYDDNYNSPGVRGFSRPGDYGNRILVLLDGHPMNDNWIWSSYIGFDARADIDDVERIEVIRGAGSIVYGTGAFFGVINLITRDRDEPTHAEVAASSALGAGRARATLVLNPRPRVGFWLSVAGAKSAGIDRFYPEYVSEETATGPSSLDFRGNPATGVVRDADGFRVGTVGGRARYEALSARWLLTSHEKHSPSAPYGTPFGNPNTVNTDTRSFAELQFEPVWANFESLTRISLDSYHYSAVLPYAPNTIDPESFGTENDEYTGLWGSAEQRLVFKLPPGFKFTLGGAYTRHFKTHQYNIDDRARAGYTGPDAGPISDTDTPFDNVAGYLLTDAVITPRVHVSAGARVDYFSKLDFDAGAALSPRLALIVKPYERGNLKIMAGKAFRVPSVYERFYVSATQIEPSSIKPEQVYSAETEFSHRFSSAVTGLVTAYANYVTDLIELGTVSQNGEDLNQYGNSDAPVLVLGAETEVRHDFRQGWMLAASFSLNSARYLKADNLRHVPNSPLVLGAAKGAMPIIGRSLALATRISVEGPRYDNQIYKADVACDPDGLVALGCPKQGTTTTGVVWDLVFTGAVDRFNASYAVGVYNAMDWQYDTVPSTEFVQRTIQQRPRSFLASLSLKF